MPIKRTKTICELAITQEGRDFNKTLHLGNIEVNSDNAMLPIRLAGLLACAEIKAQIDIPLDKSWVGDCWDEFYLTHRNTDETGIFIVKDGVVADYPVQTENLVDALDIASEFWEYKDNLKRVNDVEGLFYSFTTDVNEALITDKKTFFALVDIYKNHEIQYLWSITDSTRLHDYGTATPNERFNLFKLLPESIRDALLVNRVFKSWQDILEGK